MATTYETKTLPEEGERLNSGNISVFPTAGRTQWDPYGRLTTEYNLTSLLNVLLDEDSFVITDPSYSATYYDADETKLKEYKSNSISEGTFQFNIKGYIFTIWDISSLLGDFSGSNSIWAYISLTNTNIDGSANPNNSNNIKRKNYYLEGGDSKSIADSSSDYGGVQFSDDNDTNGIKDKIDSTSDASLDSVCRLKNNNMYALKILEKIGDNWYIPEDSKIKFKTTTSGNKRSITIDDGILGLPL